MATLLPVVEKRVLGQVSRVVIHGTLVHRISFVNGLIGGQFWRFLEVLGQILYCLKCVPTVILVGKWLLGAFPELFLVWVSVGQIFQIALERICCLKANILVLSAIGIDTFTQFLCILFLAIDGVRKNAINKHALIEAGILLLSCCRLHLVLTLNTLSLLFCLEKLRRL